MNNLKKPNMKFVKGSQKQFEVRIVKQYGVRIKCSEKKDTTQYYLNKELVGEWTENGFQGMGFWNGWHL